MSGLSDYGKQIDDDSDGTAYTLHILLLGHAKTREFAVYQWYDDGIMVEEFRGDEKHSDKMFIPASAIITIEVEWS